MVAGEHGHGNAGIAQVHQRGQDANPGAMHDALPLEPEFEQVAVDQQRRRTTREGAKEGEEQSLGVRRRVTEMYVGDDVAGRGEHAVSLHGLHRMHKPDRLERRHASWVTRESACR